MITLQPSLRIGLNVWDRVKMPETEFRSRLEQVKRKMQNERIDVLIIYSKDFNEYGNTSYISNFIARLPGGTLIGLPRNHEPTLFFKGSSRAVPFAKTTTWIADVKACSDVSKECVNYLNDRAFVPSTVGMVGVRQFMPYHQVSLL